MNNLLSDDAKELLYILISHLQMVKPGDPRTYLNDKSLHDLLDLSPEVKTWEKSLQLANWIKVNGFPAITGIIIDTATMMPDPGYFWMYDRKNDDSTWWEQEISRVKEFNWQQIINSTIHQSLQDSSSEKIHWIMKITPDKSYKTARYFDELFGVNKPNVIGYGDAEGGGRIEYNREKFFKEMKNGHRILVLQGVNKVHGIVEIIGEAKDERDENHGEWDWFPYRRKVRLVHRFKEPFETRNRTNMNTIIPGDSEGAAGIINEVKSRLADDSDYDPNRTRSIITEEVNSKIPSFVSDVPGTDDALGRTDFARFIAEKLYHLWQDDNADAVKNKNLTKNSIVAHINGPWGSGKSNFLNLLEKQFTCGDFNNWTVIKFNAWQNQHVEPVWWPLMDTITKGLSDQGISSLDHNKRGMILNRDEAWRKTTILGIPLDFIGIGSLVLMFIIVIASGDSKWTIIQNWGASVTAIIALLSLIAKLFDPISNLRSSTSAKFFEKISTDPVKAIRVHFNELIDIADKPIVVFIDDLDRCREDYVVSLIESLHNFFNNSGIMYLVAADRDWIANSFAISYKDMGAHGYDSPQQLGYHFAEKLFQLNITIPSISSMQKRLYIQSLLSVDQKKPALSSLPEEFDSSFPNEPVLEDIEKVADKRKEALNFLASRESDTEIEHRLIGFADYIEPNPRFIKLLVNTHGMNMASAIVCGWLSSPDEKGKVDYIIRWSILSLRFPSAASAIVNRLEIAKEITDENFLEGMPERNKQTLLAAKRSTDFMDLLKGSKSPNMIGEIPPDCISALSGREIT